eukprot:3626797-Pyramimonas_sp.AAC.1
MRAQAPQGADRPSGPSATADTAPKGAVSLPLGPLRGGTRSPREAKAQRPSQIREAIHAAGTPAATT